jgi:hypothetical protein
MIIQENSIPCKGDLLGLFVVDYNHREFAQLKPFRLDLGKRLIRKNFERSFKDMLLVTGGGFRNLMFPLWFTLLGDSFVFLNIGPSILFLIFPFFLGALVHLWLQGFII